MLTGVLSLFVSAAYLVVNLLVLPGIRLDWPAVLFAALFFVGCSITHMHIALHLIVDVPLIGGEHGNTVAHGMQVVGAAGFIYMMAARRIVVRSERR